MNLLDSIIYKKVIHLTRKDIVPEKINKYSKHVLTISGIIFILTSFSYNFSLDGALFGVKIYVNVIPALFEILFISLFTFVLYRYNSKFDYFIEVYRTSIKNLNQVICAFEDCKIDKKVYDIKQDNNAGWLGRNDYYIEVQYGRYYFNDYRVFKFVDVKNSRKLKLKKLMSEDE